MNLQSSLILSGTILGAALLTPALIQGGGTTTLKHQALNNCVIDIRPISSPEAQVYYEGRAYGAQFNIHVGMSDVLEFGNWDATKNLKLKTGAPNVLSWAYDPATGKVNMTLRNNVDPDMTFDTRFSGSYDPLGPLGEPVIEDVRGPASNKRRVRISLQNFGLTVSWTITDL